MASPISHPFPVAAPRRADIQGLRALAVLLVVGYHLFPHQLRGGYVGVDVFFVISGFLITGQLVREVARTGRMSLLAFWGRRLRRLLPAALLVLAVCLIATRAFVPSTLWGPVVQQVAASTLYVENWMLAADSVDYLRQGADVSLVQHYWSLSIEEQFYVIWPLVIALILVLWRLGRKPVRTASAILVVLAILSAASLVWSVAETALNPGVAYFSTFSRIWELGAGALLALAGTTVRGHVARFLIGWGGLVAIVASAVAFTDATPFPGFAAVVPVAGALAVIAAGSAPEHPRSVAAALSLRPAVFIGDISYSVYLWHLPLIVLAPYLIGFEPTLLPKLGVLLVTFALAVATTRWVESPLRRLPALTIPPWRPFVAAAIAMALVLSGTAALEAERLRRVDAAESVGQTVASELDDAVAAALGDSPASATAPATACLGPAALESSVDCGPPTGDGPLLLPAGIVGSRGFEPHYVGCLGEHETRRIAVCELGDLSSPSRTIALVGDSHTLHWGAAFDVLGRALGWRIVVSTKRSCPFTATTRVVEGETAGWDEICSGVNTDLVEMLIARGDVDAVVTSAFGSAYGWQGDPASGLARVSAQLAAAGIPLVVIRDVPLVKDKQNSPACLEQFTDPLTCSLPRADALAPDPYADAARAVGIPVLDLTDEFCDAEWCYAIVGDVVVYADYSHLSYEYSTLLAPALYRALSALGNDTAFS